MKYIAIFLCILFILSIPMSTLAGDLVKVQGTVKGEPLLPTHPLPPSEKPPTPDKRTVVIKWKYPDKTRSAPVVSVWVSVDGGPWVEMGKTLPGALNYTYETQDVNVTHCSYLVPITRNGIEGKPSPTVCEFVDEIPSPINVQVQAQ